MYVYLIKVDSENTNMIENTNMFTNTKNIFASTNTFANTRTHTHSPKRATGAARKTPPIGLSDHV